MSEENFIKIDSVLVDPRIFTTPYSCDVERYKCESMCCYRACIAPDTEIKRVKKHLNDIIPYLGEDNREAIRKSGFVAKCERQCPQGCEIHPDEARAARRLFKDNEEFKCFLIYKGACVFLYTNKEGLKYCSIHTYAMEKGMEWEAFKMKDCVQYPLSVYIKDGKKVLTIQDTPYLSHIPCMKDNTGEPMYKSLEGTITALLGKRFNTALQGYGEKKYG
ncbi:MAG: DUF3109 domain-containing protein [Nitrospirota bacterium]|jgi:hypothetical protein